MSKPKIVLLVILILAVILYTGWAILEGADFDVDPWSAVIPAYAAEGIPLPEPTWSIFFPAVLNGDAPTPRPTPTPFRPTPTPAPTMDPFSDPPLPTPGEVWYIAPPRTTNLDLYSPVILDEAPEIFDAYELKPCDFCEPTVYFHAFWYQGSVVWGFPEDRTCRVC